MYSMIDVAEIGPPFEASRAARSWMNAPVAATSANRFAEFRISISLVAASEPMIPANTSPEPAVASQGVAVGNSIIISLFATTVCDLLSKTVTPKISAHSCAQRFGSSEISSAEVLIPFFFSSLANSPACGVIKVGCSNFSARKSAPAGIYLMGYTIGALVVEALSAIAGPQGAMAVVTLLGRGQTYEQAFKSVYGISWAEAAPILAKVVAAEYAATP